MALLTDSEADAGPVKIGDLFQGYQIVKLLGQGGYASVYHARREFIDRDVAIKISHRAVTREVFKRFRGEARLTHRLDHPNIVKVEDAAVATSGHLYIVMELLRGQTFWDARKQYGKFTIPEALHLCAQVADGVEQAHRVGVIHRDLKPLNLFIIAANRAKVLDFGIAKIPDDGDGSSTQRNIVHGTLKYMSADQLMGKKLTAQSDIYALGVILFELITGQHPHIAENARPTEAELGFAIVSRPPASLAEIDPSIPSFIVEVAERALSRDPEKQFASMAAFAEALRQCYERYVRALPQFAELRELWVAAPSASAVVRSAEPPSQEHIATAVVAVVPPQSSRPTVRMGTAPTAHQLPPQPKAPVITPKLPAPVPQVVTPAPVTGGVAVASPSSVPQRQAPATPTPALTLRRIISIGAAGGFVLGIALMVARIASTSSSPRTSSSAAAQLRPPPSEPTAASAQTVANAQAPSSTSPAAAAIPAEAEQPTSATSARPAVRALTRAPAPRPATSTGQSKARQTAQPDKDIADRVNWFQEEKRPTKPTEPKSGL